MQVTVDQKRRPWSARCKGWRILANGDLAPQRPRTVPPAGRLGGRRNGAPGLTARSTPLVPRMVQLPDPSGSRLVHVSDVVVIEE